MTKLKSVLTKVSAARWFPTITKPILVGAVGSGAVYALHALAGINVLPAQAEAAAAPLVGFLLTAITQKSEKGSTSVGTAHVTVVAHTLSGGPSIGKTIASEYVEKLASAIDSDPALVQEIARKAMERVAEASVTTPAVDVQKVVADAVRAAVATPLPQAVTSPASEAAPHITQ